MKVSQTNLSACLNISIDFLLQHNSLEELTSFQDNNGYTLLHWAVLNHDSQKVNELLSINFKLCNSFNNFIPDLPVDVSKSRLALIPNLLIPFNKDGYSPLHLCIYLINLYQTNNLDNLHKFSNYITEQKNIFTLFFKYNDNSNILDQQGYSYVDYCFILENIELLFMLDKPYEAYIDILNNVQFETGLKIIERLITKKLLFSPETLKKLELLSECLIRNIQHNKLENKVPNKFNLSKLKKI